tara:strand:+ start:2726 stop:3076 length:351 start_codon:yes stop_codon:yes gene_type:complete
MENINKLKLVIRREAREAYRELELSTKKDLVNKFMEISNASGKLDGASETQISAYRSDIMEIVSTAVDKIERDVMEQLDPYMDHPLSQSKVKDFYIEETTLLKALETIDQPQAKRP